MRVTTAKHSSHRNSWKCVRPPGGLNSAANAPAKGRIEAAIRVWRRPSGARRRLSDQTPTIGSVTASTTSAAAIAAPVRVPGTPSTWV